jgi:hypothetical protein
MIYELLLAGPKFVEQTLQDVATVLLFLIQRLYRYKLFGLVSDEIYVPKILLSGKPVANHIDVLSKATK